MLYVLKTVQNLSLKEIDDIIEDIANCGYRGAVLPRDGDWEQLRGFCRSAGYRDLKLWLRDDVDDPSGSFGGEVTSVPSFISQQPELWGCAPYDPEAAEAFMDCSYSEMKRELGRFLGYELAGVVTRFGKADEAFAETQLLPISEFCKNNRLELIAQTDYPAPYADTKTAFADFTGMSLAQRQRELCALYAKGMKRIAIEADLFPDHIEAAWCKVADRLAELLPGEPQPVDMAVPAVKFSNNACLLYNDGSDDTEVTLDLDAMGAKYIADIFGGVYFTDSTELTFTLKGGGCLVLLPEAADAEPLPPVLNCGAVFGEFVKAKGEVSPAIFRDGPAACRAELPVDCRGKYLRLRGNFICAFVKIGRRRQLLPMPPFMLPLFSTDEGRTAEIIVIPANTQKTVSFSQNSINIVSVKNQAVF